LSDRQDLGNIETSLTDELGDRGGIEAGGVVLYAQSAGFAIETEAADAVYVARAGEGESHGVTGRCGVAKKNFHRGHKGMIPRCGTESDGGNGYQVEFGSGSQKRDPEQVHLDCRQLEALEKGADFGIGPVLGTDELAADDALAVDDVGFRPHVRVEELGGSFIRVADGDQVNAAPGDEVAVGVGVFVDADGQDGEVGLVVVQIEQGGQLHHARLAPGSPEVEQDDLAPVVGEVNGGRAIGDGEVRGRVAGLAGMRTAVAGRQQGQRQEENGDEETREPHILIIRSKRPGRKGGA